MSDKQVDALAVLIQSYAAARWGKAPDRAAAAELGGRLDRKTRDRVDMLGGDAEQLLAVAVAHVMSELERLEAEAALEDATARPRAGAPQSEGARGGRRPSADRSPAFERTGMGRQRPNRLGKRRGGG